MHYRYDIVAAPCSTLLATSRNSHLAYEPVLDLIACLPLDLGSQLLAVYPFCLEALLKTTFITKSAAAGDEQGADRQKCI